MSTAPNTVPCPTLGRVFRAQLKLIVSGRRLGVLIALAVILAQIIGLATAGALFGVRITVEGGEEEKQTTVMSKVSDFDDEVPFPIDEGSSAVTMAFFCALLWAFFWPYRVWRGEGPAQRGYHWAMPVDRRTHDLLRVAAGALWLFAFTLLFSLLAPLLSQLSGHGALLPVFSPTAWLSMLVGPQLVYILVSIPTLGSDRAAGWVWGVIGILFGLSILGEAVPVPALLRALDNVVGRGALSLGEALAGPFLRDFATLGPTAPGRWLLALGLWGSAALAALYGVASARRRGL